MSAHLETSSINLAGLLPHVPEEEKREVAPLLKLDLACGQNKRDGFHGVDTAGDLDSFHDLTDFPWPFPDDSVEEVFSSHYVEHTPTGTPDGLILFMDEVYRICKDDAKVELIHPHGRSDRAFQDPTHRRFIVAETWAYFDREWREAQKLDHYPIVCDFKMENMTSGFMDPAIMQRHVDYQRHAHQHFWNLYGDVAVTLRARK